MSTPFRAHLAALNLAVFLYDRGSAAGERRAFADCLAQTPAMRERWFRALITDLRQESAGDRGRA